jgi:hypothetical protein
MKNIPSFSDKTNSLLLKCLFRRFKWTPALLIFILFGFLLINISAQASFSRTSGNNLPSENSFFYPGSEDFCQVDLVIWLYLEGTVANTMGLQNFELPMRTNLNDLRMLPGQTYVNLQEGDVYSPPGQPYNKAPWFYNGNEGDAYDSYGDPDPGTANYPSTVVDWILVSLRATPDGEAICRKAALLHDDGHVEFVGGGFSGEDLDCQGSYYILVEHRNHLMIMSDQPVPVINNTITYDFRNTQSYINDPYNLGGSGQKELLPDLPGTYAMYTGNGDQILNASSRIDLNFDDRIFWENQNMMTGHYCDGDYNLNGDCNFNDRIIFEFNNGIFTTVPAD